MLYGEILSTGFYLPDEKLANEELIKEVSGEYSEKILGVYERAFGKIDDRRKAGENETCFEILSKTSFNIIDRAIEKGFNPRNLNAIIVSSTTEDFIEPASANFVQKNISEKYNIDLDCPCFDVRNSCVGWLIGIENALHYLSTNYENILVVSGTKIGKIVFEKPAQRYIFGDGAGGVLLIKDHEKKHLNLIRSWNLGKYCETITLPRDFSSLNNKFYMTGGLILERILRENINKLTNFLKENKIETKDIDHLILHIGNGRKNLTDIILEEIKIPEAKLITNYNKYGNTVSADLSIALDESVRNGKIKKGDSVLFFSYGAGISSGAWLVCNF